MWSSDGKQQPDVCLRMPGKTLAENLEGVPDLQEGQQVIMPIDKPIKETGHLQVYNHCCWALSSLFHVCVAKSCKLQKSVGCSSRHGCTV